jgi:dipeptidyl aminopeptidase/acylaminoacyl peptidase
MAGPTVRPFGSWKSPITSDLIVSGSVGLTQPRLDRNDIYWIEMRPNEGGRNVIVKRDSSGDLTDVIPQPFNARTRVHEYGGGDYLVHEGVVYFSNFSDQRLYVQRSGGTPEPVTGPAAMRYADGIVDVKRNRLICVREDHSDALHEAVNTLVDIELAQRNECGRVLVSGSDFYSSPVLSSDGQRLAWLSWNHPNMPWNATELWVGEFASDGSIVRKTRIAGGANESIFQPEWSPDGVLYFVSDRSGWWNIYRTDGDAESIEALHPMKAEFGLPQWGFGMSTYAFASAETIVCSYIDQGFASLATIDTRTRELKSASDRFTEVGYVRAKSGKAVFLGGSPSEPLSIVELDLASDEIHVLRRGNDLKIDPALISEPQAIEFPTEDNLTAHAFFYAPKNPEYRAPEGELPPLLVKSHGGPTSSARTSQSPSIQYWTSRGVAVLDVDYGGSTGYGRAYRERLRGKWGIVDVDDCVNAARYLVAKGVVDSQRLMITGGSAGGYTTLCALTFRDTFRAGASHYGVSDAEALAKDTHKFESHYLDQLFGPYPEQRGIYYERSPINFADHLSCPVIFFQGLEDRVVPPNQAEMMVEALKSKGIPVAYVPFPGEQHGFRQAPNIKRALDGELYFYSRVFGFELGELEEPVAIANLG